MIKSLKKIFGFESHELDIKKKNRVLVVHPIDTDTNMLESSYIEKDGLDYIRFPYYEKYEDFKIAKNILFEKINNYKYVFFIGHGTSNGLVHNGRRLVSNSDAKLLKNKKLVCLWSNSNAFLKRHSLNGKGFGILIFNYNDAEYHCLEDFTQRDIDFSMEKLSYTLDNVLGYFFLNDDIVQRQLKEFYYSKKNNPIVSYNINSMISNE
jgi:hypothetical protein